MVYPSSKLDAAKNPQTRCSNCQTVFEVSRELLSSSDTRVRCGECLSIFDALEELRSAEQIDQEERYARESSTSSKRHRDHSERPSAKIGSNYEANNEAESLDVTYSDFDLFSDEAELPEIAYFDQTRDTPDFDFDAVEMGNDETFSDTLFVHDVTIDADATTLRSKTTQAQTESSPDYAEIDFVADEQPREPLIFKYRDPEPEEAESDAFTQAEPHPSDENAVTGLTGNAASGSILVANDESAELHVPHSSNPWWFRLGMLLLLGILLGSLYAYRTRPQLYNNPTIRPMLEAGCELLNCTIPARVDLASLKMVKRNVFSHPNTPNELIITVSFRNDADFAQQLPVLQMVLSNRVGRTVDKQDFSPAEYMPNWQEGSTIGPNQQLDVKLEVADPGQDAQSFEFYFREFNS